MNTPNDGGPAYPGLDYVSGYGCTRLVLDGSGNVHHYEQHSPGMSLRAWLTGKAIQGFLASEGEETGQLYAIRKDPNTGLNTHRETVYPINPSTNSEDYTKPSIPTILVMTPEQHLVYRAIQIADEAIRQLSIPQPDAAASQPQTKP